MSNRFQIKLSQYETPPSPELWKRIADILDEDPAPVTREKLYSYEQKPPAHIWNNISMSMGQQAKVVPFYKKRIVYQYSGAAAILILMVITTSLLLSKKTAPDNGVPAATTVLKQEKLTVQHASETPQMATTHKEPQTIAKAVYADAYLPVRRNFLTRERLQHILTSVNSFTNLFPQQAEAKPQSINLDTSDKYLIYSDEDGHAFRIPKKIFDLFSCSLQDPFCRQRINALQEQIITGSMSTDFTGVMDMLNSLKENQ